MPFNTRKIGIVMALAVFTATVFFFSRTSAQSTAVFFLEPASGSHQINTGFPVALKINTPAAVTSVKAYLSFNPAVIRVNSIDATGSVFTAEWENAYNNTTGKIQLQRSLPSPGYTGSSGLVATINFQAVAQGTGSATYDSTSLALKSDDTNVLNLAGSTAGSYTVTVAPPSDTTPPYTTSHNPIKSASDIASSTNIVVQVKDSGSGVNQGAISMKVEGLAVTPAITGTLSSYTLTYNPSADFDYDQVVNVTIDASDLAAPANVMPQDSYFFIVASSPPPPCTNVGLSSPAVNPITPEANQTFSISCPANSNNYDCLLAETNGLSCAFSSWSGNNAVFNCNGLANGSYTATCQAIIGTGSNCCSDQKTQPFSVNDSAAPVRSEAYPTGLLAAGTTEINIRLTANEAAVCKYSTSPGTSYDAMTGAFTVTDVFYHSSLVQGLANGSNYSFYARCQDTLSNKNTDDFPIQFSVSSLPPPPSGGDGGAGGGGGGSESGDATPPVISNIKVKKLSLNSISVSWTTDEISTSQVEYGTTQAFGSLTPLDPTLTTEHTVKMTDLLTKTLIYFRAISRDNYTNLSASPSGTFMLLVGDFNGDGKVNIFDFSILLSNWKKANALYDLKIDGVINLFDLRVLLSNWFK